MVGSGKVNLEEEFNNQTELRKTLIKIRTSLKEGTEEEKNEMRINDLKKYIYDK